MMKNINTQIRSKNVLNWMLLGLFCVFLTVLSALSACSSTPTKPAPIIDKSSGKEKAAPIVKSKPAAQNVASAKVPPKEAPAKKVASVKSDVKPVTKSDVKSDAKVESKADSQISTATEPKVDSSAMDENLKLFKPANGQVVGSFDGTTNKGIDIAGKLGDPVLAAADGKVVYAGNSLRGYGNLVIVKHDNTYLTAYAHNKNLLVKEGDSVRRGQKIAEMGNTEADRVKLHFELRRNGKPIDPSRYLQ